MKLQVIEIAQALAAAVEHGNALKQAIAGNALDAIAAENLGAVLLRIRQLHRTAYSAFDLIDELDEQISQAIVGKMQAYGLDDLRMEGGGAILAECLLPAPKIDDMLPEGVQDTPEFRQKYQGTFKGVDRAGMIRLAAALKSSSLYAHMVEESIDYASIIDELCNDDVPRNAGAMPILPDTLKDCLTIKRSIELVLIDPAGNAIQRGGELEQ